MKKATLETIAKLLKGEKVENAEAVKATAIEEIEAEVNKGAEEKAEKAALYAAAEPVVMAAMPTDKDVTLKELWDEVQTKEGLPAELTYGQFQRAVTILWADKVIKTPGKPNGYRRAQ